SEPNHAEPDMRGVRVFGELAVHRESLERVLNENPQSLGSVLLALISALGGQKPSTPSEERDEEPVYAIT
ncbi:MAG TPA: hypothetical protein VLL05_06810, partial [Terriglobales bacterium]|nr:hypothetical protein [Terriglobales bacterium]